MDCVVFGVGGAYLGEVLAVLHRLGWDVRAFVSNEDGAPNPNDVAPLVHLEDMSEELASLPCILGVSTPEHRRAAHEAATTAGFRTFPPVVDPSAVVAHDASVGAGVLVNAGVVVGAGVRLGPFSLINRSSSIGHDCTVHDYGVIGPGVTVCGGCAIRSGAFVGAGAVLTPGAVVGVGATVGAGSVVRGEVPAGAQAIGSPARIRGG